ncbi:hypothetical protein [Sphingomonas arenae]|uniref:hypothetical protein n=1 Tax=Sphingomonas arenae TaxID=2812555 RepID=UPI001967B473|nr:hypothetical protein [Sphingomonas arenae]
MRKFFIAAAVATSAIAAASPAAAQYYPGQGYGYRLDQSSRNYIVKTDQLRSRIEQLDRRNRISEREARWLRSHAADLQQRARSYAQSRGLNSRERHDLDNRIAWLRSQIRDDVRDGNNGWRDGQYRNRDRDGRWDRRDGWSDRDRDGRDDRYEDDRGRYPG